MMMYSFSFGRRLRRSTLLLLLLLAVMAAGRAVLLMLPGSDAAVSASNIRRQPGKTEEQRQAFLAALGLVGRSGAVRGARGDHPQGIR